MPQSEGQSSEIQEDAQTNSFSGQCRPQGNFTLLATVVVAVSLVAVSLIYFTSSAEPVEPSTASSLTTKLVRDEVTDFRLPTSVSPIHQLVRLQPFLLGNNSVEGHTEITINVHENTFNVTLHMVDIVTKNETVRIKPSDNLQGPGVSIASHSYDVARQFYVIALNEGLTQNQTYLITIDFIGYVNDKLLGFYRSHYTDIGGEDKLVAVTQFAAIEARRSFPCFDEPALKANFSIQIARQDPFMTISNMPLLSTINDPEQPGWIWDTFEESLPMSSYLVAFVMSEFVSANSTENDHVLFRVWTRDRALEEASYALDIGPKILTFYEAYYQIPFPLPKQDMVAIPDFYFGAMENWGLITYKESTMLYDPRVSSATNKQRVCEIVAHELAHQWFGNLVTADWWNDIWLNEGFATFIQYIGCDAVEPLMRLPEQFLRGDLFLSFNIDALESSHPLSRPIETPGDIGTIYDVIAYSKGGSILRMMYNFLTEATFNQALFNYLNELSYSSAVQDDLWNYMTAQAHIDGTLDSSLTVKEIMDTWTLQTGFPVITIIRHDNLTATLTQERFLLLKNNTPAASNNSWWVPLNFAWQSNPDFTKTTALEWLEPSERVKQLAGMPSKSEWIVANIQETGYYRVNYDIDNWNAIISQLLTNFSIIHTINRAQIIDDAMNLAKAELVSYETGLGTYSYLGNETEFIVWDAALDNIEYIEKMFTRTADYVSLRSYLLSLLIPLYDSIGFEDDINDSHMEQLMRSLVVQWTCHLGHQPCISNAVALYTQWMANPNNYTLITPNVKRTVYCIGVQEGGESEWNFAWDRYMTVIMGSERDNLVYAMGCSTEQWILANYLDLAFTAGSGFRSQDSSKAFSSVSENDNGRDLAWNFVREEQARIYNYSGNPSMVSSLVNIASEEFNTEEELRELQQFKDDNEDDLTSSVDQAIERTKTNIAWMKLNYDEIEQWLSQNGFTTRQVKYSKLETISDEQKNKMPEFKMSVKSKVGMKQLKKVNR